MRYYAARTDREKRRRQLIGLGIGAGLLAVGGIAYAVLGLFLDPVPEWFIAVAGVAVLVAAVAGELFVARRPEEDRRP